jgi:hypothetical protein
MAPKNIIARLHALQSLIIWASIAAIFATVLGSFGAGIVQDIASATVVTVVRIISAIISVASLVVICWAVFFRALPR